MFREWVADDGNTYPVGAATTAKLDAVFGEEWPSLHAVGLIIMLLQRRAAGARGIVLDRHTRFQAWLMGCSGVDVRRAREHAARFDNIPPLWLHKEVRTHLSACDDIVNMNNAVDWLQGRDFRECFDTIDQVHGNSSMLACGCVLQFMFDHHLRGETNKVGQYWHYPAATCERHAHLASDYIAHYAAAISEEQERNRVWGRRMSLRLIHSLGQAVEDRVLRRLGIRTNSMKLAA